METTDELGFSQTFWVTFGLILLVVILLAIVAGWRLFQKAGQPGWLCLVPIYNGVVLMKIVGRPTWHCLLLLLPIYTFYALPVELCNVFGRRSMGDQMLAVFFGIFYLPYLAFSSSVEYVGPVNKEI